MKVLRQLLRITQNPKFWLRGYEDESRCLSTGRFVSMEEQQLGIGYQGAYAQTFIRALRAAQYSVKFTDNASFGTIIDHITLEYGGYFGRNLLEDLQNGDTTVTRIRVFEVIGKIKFSYEKALLAL